MTMTSTPARMDADWLQWRPYSDDSGNGCGRCRRCSEIFTDAAEFGTWRTHVCQDMAHSTGYTTDANGSGRCVCGKTGTAEEMEDHWQQEDARERVPAGVPWCTYCHGSDAEGHADWCVTRRGPASVAVVAPIIARVRHLNRQRASWLDIPEWVRPGSPVLQLAIS